MYIAIGYPVSREEFFMEVDIAFGVHTWLGLVGFEFNGAVDIVILERFVEVSTIAEDTEGGVPAVDVSLVWVVGVGEQVHRGPADAVLSGALGAGVGTYVVSCFGKKVAVAGVACVDGFLWGDAEEA